MRILRQFLHDDDGPTTVEYAVLLAGILALCIGGITTVGGEVFNYWENNQESIDAAIETAHGS